MKYAVGLSHLKVRDHQSECEAEIYEHFRIETGSLDHYEVDSFRADDMNKR
jgi:hypothetical protein